MLISSCDFKICFFHAPIIALNKFGSRSNTRAWWRPYWFWSFSCFLQDFNYSASCTLGKKIGGTVCKPAPLQPWFRCMPPVHLDHQSQALHLDLLGSSNPSSKHRSISRCPAGQQAWLSSLQEPRSCSAATAAGYLVFSSPPLWCFTSFT